MRLVADAKRFVKDSAKQLESELPKIARQPEDKRMLLASQLIGQCDSLCAVLLFLGEAAPRQFGKFAEAGREKLEATKRTAMRIRATAYKQLQREVDELQGELEAYAQQVQQSQPAPQPEPEAQPGEFVVAEPVEGEPPAE